jgi:hypothetical protein
MSGGFGGGGDQTSFSVALFGANQRPARSLFALAFTPDAP